MRFYNILQYLLINIGNSILSLNIKYYFNNLYNKNTEKTLTLYDNLKRTSIISKMIYEYDYTYKMKSLNNQVDEVIKLNHCNFFKNNIKYNKYIELYQQYYKDSDLLGYFVENRLYCLFILNHTTKEINIIFRGSNYIDEWIENLNIGEREINFGNNLIFNLHNGMYNNYKKYNSDKNIENILNKLFDKYPKYKIIFTGHSKGNINSILTAFKLTCNNNNNNNFNNNVYDIYCYGSPPIFNYEFANILHNNKNLNIYNIINENDIIPHLPYKYQIGMEIKINNFFIESVNHDEPYYLKSHCFITNICESIFDHDLDNYIDKILNINNI